MAARSIDDIIERVEAYSKSIVREKAKEYDRLEVFPEETFRHLADLGVLRIPFNRLDGGLEGTVQDILQVIRMVSRECASTASGLLTQLSFGILPIYCFGTDAQKRRCLPSMLAGETLGAFALNEMESGNDLSKMKTVAIEKDDGWELSGTKDFISHAGIADFYSVAARTISTDGTKSFGIFLVRPEMNGVTIGPSEEKMGIRGMPVASLTLENVQLSPDSLLGGEPDGEEPCHTIKDYNKLLVAAQGIGIAEGVFERALEYLQQDRKFGQRLIDLPNNQYQLADAYTEITAASSLLEQVQEFDPAERRLHAMIKLKSSSTAVETAETALQLTGGYGYLSGNDIERFVRDAQLIHIYGGGSDTQKSILSRPWVKKQRKRKEEPANAY